MKPHKNARVLKDLLKCSHLTKKRFEAHYDKLQGKEVERFYLSVLNELEKAVSEGNYKTFTTLSSIIEYIGDKGNAETLKVYYSNADNAIKNTNLVILACKHNQVEILKHILDNSNFLPNLSNKIKTNAITPEDEDDMCHNSFYYAIRSGNVELLEILINIWPDNYFATHLTELDEILSSTYEELKLKNVLLSHEIEIFVESKLLDLRFFSSSSEQRQKITSDLIDIKECVHLVLDNVSHNFSNSSEHCQNVTFDLDAIKKRVQSVLENVSHNFSSSSELCQNVTDDLEVLEEQVQFVLKNISSTFSSSSEQYQKVTGDLDAIKQRVQLVLENVSCFFCSSSEQCQNVSGDLNATKERIQLVLGCISQLVDEYYSNENEIDEKFLYILKFIAQNINVAKRQLRSTYDRLPWEEIEFCLIIFICSHIKQQEINLFVHAILKKDKMINYLKLFAIQLAKKDVFESVDVGKLTRLPRLMRDKAITEIINNNPEFEELYDDYQQIRDIYSLEKISYSVNIALSVAPEQTEYRLVIIRSLQVIGEYLKNTLESPNLSSAKIKLLLLSLEQNTRKIIMKLRDSLSHAENLTKRIEIEKNMDTEFVVDIQNDLKKIGDVISNILFNGKIKMIKLLLETIINSETLNELEDVSAIISHVGFDEMIGDCFEMIEHKKICKCIVELNNVVNEKTYYEQQLIDQINDIINAEKYKTANIKEDYLTGLHSLKSLFGIVWNDYKIDKNVVRNTKFEAKEILSNFLPETEPFDLQQIFYFLTKLLRSLKSRMHDKIDEVNRLMLEMFIVAEFTITNIKWIKELGETLGAKCRSTSTSKQNKTDTQIEKEYNNILKMKLSELERVLNKNPFNNKTVDFFTYFKCNKKLQNTVEMLVLDIMSLLSDSKQLQENNLFLDDNTPLLTGRCMRNHLAHYNDFVDLLLSDSSTAVILNAKKLISENVTGNKNIFGRSIKCNLSKLKCRYGKGLSTIINKTNMFSALEKGDMESFKTCLENGADISARNSNSWTTLHFACKGPSLDIVKLILNENPSVNAKNVKGQNALHIAAAYGRKYIVMLFAEELDIDVQNADKLGRTPLHLAALNGHRDTVDSLIQNKSKTTSQDICGILPLHYAVRNDHLEVVKLLLEKDGKVDNNETMGGFTPLHVASERGNLKLVTFLLKNGANVNAKTDKDWMPLHAAAFSGHLEVVKALISKGAEVNPRGSDGFTALHFAAENGHEMVVDVLINHGADVNAFHKTYNNTPLHYAARDGYEGIAKILLDNEANVNVSTKFTGMTPLLFAAKSGHLEIVTLLLRHNNLDVNAQNINRTAALHYATDKGYLEMLDLLIENGARLNIKDNLGFTPLHKAALKNEINIFKLLVEKNAEINARTRDGYTPLHIAVKANSRNVIDFLIKIKIEVNIQDDDGLTALHLAALNGYKDSIALLIENDANVNTKDNEKRSPLHAAAFGGDADTIDILIKSKAGVNAIDCEGNTPLCHAVLSGHKEAVEMLIKNGANINSNDDISKSPLLLAVQTNNKEIVQVLLSTGVDINEGDREALQLAVFSGYKDIVDILLKCKLCINTKQPDNSTLLHIAAKRGQKDIVKSLIKSLISKEADVDDVDIRGETPLSMASREGHSGIVQILIDNKANVNTKSEDGTTPLHVSSIYGHRKIVEILLNNGANINSMDNKNRKAVELAVAKGHLQIVKTLFQYNIDINAKGNDDWTLLHIATQENNMEIIKYLVSNGSDIHRKTASGAKPVHIAAREGFKDIVEFFLNKGSSIKDLGMANQTLLHYASINGKLEVAQYLILKGADVNARDVNGMTPIHIAAICGCKDVIIALLNSGGDYSVLDNRNRKPSELTTNRDVYQLLKSTENLFKAVKQNNISETEDYIKEGAVVNAIKAGNATPLHYASWKGYLEIVEVLLRNKSNPNAVGSKGSTPLHYASKFSHFKIVRTLLCYGAVYNVISYTWQTPLDFAIHKNIKTLLLFVSNIFTNVTNNNSKFIKDLNKEDIDTVKAVLNARNTENQTIVVSALLENFSKVEELKAILQGDVSSKIATALNLLNKGSFRKALFVLNSVLEKRKDILGPDNPGTLDIQTHIARVLYKQGTYDSALKMLEKFFQKQKEMLGLRSKYTLCTRSLIASVLHRLGREEESLGIHQEVYRNQLELLGANHDDTLETQLHMALALDSLGKYDEALLNNQLVYKKRKETRHPAAISAQNNIAVVLTNQGKYDEALKVYKEVLQKKENIFGVNHSDTLRTSHNIAMVLFKQKEFSDALKEFEKLSNIQTKVLGPLHPDTLRTRHNMAKALFAQRKWLDAFKMHRQNLPLIKSVWGSNHSYVLGTLEEIEIIKLRFKMEGSNELDILQWLQKDIIIASNDGDIQTVKYLLKNGADVNEKDIEGRTPFHFAVNNGHIDIVSFLLKNGGDPTQITNTGNTPLHTAACKGNKEVVNILLEHLSNNKLNDFINAKTIVGGKTSLHVAAKFGYSDIVLSLLEHGAIYDVENKESIQPLDISTDQYVSNLLKFLKELFQDAKTGNVQIIDKLKTAKSEEILAITNARNNQGKTLLQVLINHNHKKIANEFAKILQNL